MEKLTGSLIANYRKVPNLSFTRSETNANEAASASNRENRCGMVGSSGAARLRAEGLEPSSSFHADYPWEHWYLAEETDVRSSYACEVFATEFEIQGLELDWIGVCWGGDFIWDQLRGWQLRALRHGKQSKWARSRAKKKESTGEMRIVFCSLGRGREW